MVAELEKGAKRLTGQAAEMLGFSKDEKRAEELPARKYTVPYVVRIGGIVLCTCAGITNVVSFLALQAFTSHVTGTISKVGMGLENDGRFDARVLSLLLAAFLAEHWEHYICILYFRTRG